MGRIILPIIGPPALKRGESVLSRHRSSVGRTARERRKNDARIVRRAARAAAQEKYHKHGGGSGGGKHG